MFWKVLISERAAGISTYLVSVLGIGSGSSAPTVRVSETSTGLFSLSCGDVTARGRRGNRKCTVRTKNEIYIRGAGPPGRLLTSVRRGRGYPRALNTCLCAGELDSSSLRLEDADQKTVHHLHSLTQEIINPEVS